MNTVSIQISATALILLSALLHAAVNTLIKVSDDGLMTRGCMNAVACIAAVPFLCVVPFPDGNLWLLLAVSVLIHGLYPFFLVEAYRAGDLSATFPLARGSAPLFVVLFAVCFLGQTPGPVSLAGIVLVSLAVASLAFDRSPKTAKNRMGGIAAALITGLIVAAYTAVDAVGLHLASTPFTYIVWLFVLDGAFVALAVALARRRAVPPFIARNWKAALIAGILGVLTYGLALLALSLGPVAQIAALRETSIFFAALIGTLVLGEPFGAKRIVAATLAVAGIVLMHLGL
jgi:drug/metabolite transporter (DMT)-like permease